MNEHKDGRSHPSDAKGGGPRRLAGAKAVRECEERLAEKETRRSQLIATMVHDFRGPLTSLLGFSQLVERALAEGKPCEPRYIEVIAREARRLSQMVDELADLSLVEMGRLELERQPTDIVALIQAAIEGIQPTGAHPRPSLEAEKRPLVGNWDPVRLAQALRHAVEYAVRSSSEGSQTAVALTADADKVKVTAANQGPGIPAALLPLLFEPFSRLHRERRTRGMGIGLFLAKGIIEAHGGRIWAESPDVPSWEPGENRYVLLLPR